MMFPVINNITSGKVSDSDQRGIIYKFNFESGSYELKDGNLIELTSIEDQVKQWLQFFISTEYKMYNVYEGIEYGLSLKKYIGSKTTSLGLIASEIEDQLRNGIKINEDIKDIISVKAKKENEVLILAISVKTINDTTVEVIN